MFRLYYPSRIIPKNSLKIKKKNIFSINPENVIALSQQTSAFAVCVGLEGLLSSAKQIGGTRAAASLSNSLSAAGLFFGSVALLYFEISKYNKATEPKKSPAADNELERDAAALVPPICFALLSRPSKPTHTANANVC